MSFAFNHATPDWAVLPLLAAWLCTGIGVGALYFWMLWRSALSLGAGGGAATSIALLAGRLAALGGVLFLASLSGAAPLLTAALGILVARFAFMRRVRDASA